jgi:hypothetical protein
LGIGTIWDLYGLAPSSAPCEYRFDSEASEQYRQISECTTSVPLEQEATCGHWALNCFDENELMTPRGGSSLSRITVGSLVDMGYPVDLDRADPLSSSDLDSTCDCSRRARELEADSATFDKKKPRRLSDEGMAAAVAAGMEYLEEQRQQIEQSQQSLIGGGDRDLGGTVVAVFYMENDIIYDVIVRYPTEGEK